VKPGQTAALLGPFEKAFVAQLKAHGLKTVTRLPKERPALVFFAAVKPADLNRLPKISDQGVLWLIRQKGKDAPIHEYVSRAAGIAAGLVDVKVVSFSETHSAEKYVVPLKSRGTTY
jgi:hypothetical protein